ncbi:MAG: RDD family protein [Aliarcobacter sp.]|nr:RDD family protein [Aliarcobacter sp.]
MKWRDVKQNKVQKNNINNSIEPKKKSLKNNSASLPLRLKAFLTDTFLITTPILYIVIYLIMGSGEEFAQNRSLGWGIIILVHALIILIFWLKNGQTPGLKAYDIKLVDSTSKGRVSVVQVLIRYITTFIAVLSIFLLFIPFFNKEKKTFQDMLSKTIIIIDK